MTLSPEEEATGALRAALHEAVGSCILAWSNVELRLAFIFDEVLGRRAPVSHAILGAVRSFEARLKLINDAISARFSDESSAIRTDWKLLFNHCNSLSQLRNQVAHATELLVEGANPVLEPFLVLTATKPRLESKEVEARAHRFDELSHALFWFMGELSDINFPDLKRQRLELDARLQLSIPDLVLRLRDEAAQRRAKHGRPPRSSPA